MILDDISHGKKHERRAPINMCEPFLRRECIQSQDARAYWKACCGRVGIWHCAAYYPRMHEMPCHLQTGHARCRCCCTSPPPPPSFLHAQALWQGVSLAKWDERAFSTNAFFKQKFSLTQLQMIRAASSFFAFLHLSKPCMYTVMEVGVDPFESRNNSQSIE